MRSLNSPHRHPMDSHEMADNPTGEQEAGNGGNAAEGARGASPLVGEKRTFGAMEGGVAVSETSPHDAQVPSALAQLRPGNAGAHPQRIAVAWTPGLQLIPSAHPLCHCAYRGAVGFACPCSHDCHCDVLRG